MPYRYVSDIENTVLFQYVIIFILVLTFIVKVVQPSGLHVIGFLTALFVVYYINERKVELATEKTAHYEHQLKALRPVPNFFHMDVALVNVFHNIKEFREYNTEAYDAAVFSIDNILRLKADVEKGIQNCERHFDLAKELMYKAMNHMHSFIYNTPSNKVLMDKYQDAIRTVHLLLRRHIDDIWYMCNKQRKKGDINIFTQFRYNDGPRENDIPNKEYNNHFDVY